MLCSDTNYKTAEIDCGEHVWLNHYCIVRLTNVIMNNAEGYGLITAIRVFHIAIFVQLNSQQPAKHGTEAIKQQPATMKIKQANTHACAHTHAHTQSLELLHFSCFFFFFTCLTRLQKTSIKNTSKTANQTVINKHELGCSDMQEVDYIPPPCVQVCTPQSV